MTVETVLDVKALKALGDETRMRAILAIQDRELCVCQVVSLLELAPSTVSKHLQILKDAGLVESHKKGRWVYYTISRSDAKGVPKSAVEIILATAQKSKLAKSDQLRLKKILKFNPEKLCERQKKC